MDSVPSQGGALAAVARWLPGWPTHSIHGSELVWQMWRGQQPPQPWVQAVGSTGFPALCDGAVASGQLSSASSALAGVVTDACITSPGLWWVRG